IRGACWEAFNPGTPGLEKGPPSLPRRIADVVVTLRKKDSHRTIATIKADASGQFQFWLRPGHYVVETTGQGGLTIPASQIVEVKAGLVSSVDLVTVYNHL